MPLRAIDLDWETPPRPSKTRARIARFFRAVRVATRQIYRTRYGYILIWANIALWGLFAATKLLGIQ